MGAGRDNASRGPGKARSNDARKEGGQKNGKGTARTEAPKKRKPEGEGKGHAPEARDGKRDQKWWDEKRAEKEQWKVTKEGQERKRAGEGSNSRRAKKRKDGDDDNPVSKYTVPEWWSVMPDPAQPKGSSLEEARLAYERLVFRYDAMMASESEQRWLCQAATTGTLADRVGARTMLIRQCPALTMSHVKHLLGMAGKKNQQEAALGIDALKDVFMEILPPDKLSFWAGQDSKSRPLALRYFEDELKTAFAGYVQVIYAASDDPLPFLRLKVVRACSELLQAKPEQEQALLQCLVTKVGDKMGKVSSSAMLRLQQLLQQHPLMKKLVVDQVERLAIQPSCAHASLTSLVSFLASTRLARNRKPDADVARQLVRFYVTMLGRLLTENKHGMQTGENRVVKLLLQGLHRAYPYVVGAPPLDEAMLDRLHKVGHASPVFSTRVTALAVLQRVESSPARRAKLAYAMLTHFDLLRASNRSTFLTLLEVEVSEARAVGTSAALLRRFLQLAAHADMGATSAAGLGVLTRALKRPNAPLGALLDFPEPDEDEVLVDQEEPGAVPAKAEGDGYHEHRDPAFTRADEHHLYELDLLRHHIHPFVAEAAAATLERRPGPSVARPLADLSLSSMLDQLAYVKPKKKALEGVGKVHEKVRKSRLAPANSEKFLARKRVLPHERFYRIYFGDEVVRKRREAAAAKKTTAEDADVSDLGEADDDDDVDKYFAEQMKKVAGDADPDDDDFGDDFGDVDVDDEDMLSDAGMSDADASDGDVSDAASEAVSEASEDAGAKKKRPKLTSAFASAEEYAHLLEDSD